MSARMIKAILALGFSVALLAGCASKPADNMQEEAMADDTSEVMSQPIETVTSVAPPKAAATIQNGALYELNSNDEYVAVGNGKFYFDFDQAIVKRRGLAVLNKHANYLAANSGVRVRLEGHADERGTREYNLALGERRANAVRAYLTSQGASNYQIEVISYGEEKPAIDGHDESAWSMNRRVEITYR